MVDINDLTKFMEADGLEHFQPGSKGAYLFDASGKKTFIPPEEILSKGFSNNVTEGYVPSDDKTEVENTYNLPSQKSVTPVGTVSGRLKAMVLTSAYFKNPTTGESGTASASGFMASPIQTDCCVKVLEF